MATLGIVIPQRCCKPVLNSTWGKITKIWHRTPKFGAEGGHLGQVLWDTGKRKRRESKKIFLVLLVKGSEKSSVHHICPKCAIIALIYVLPYKKIGNCFTFVLHFTHVFLPQQKAHGSTLLFIVLVQMFWLEGSRKSGPKGSRACSTGPDSQPPVVIMGWQQNLESKV